MIRHVLQFTFNEGVEVTEREAAIEQLRALGDQCPTIYDWTVGVNTTESPNASDIIEIGDFKTPEDFEAYRVHPAHKAFVEFIRPLATWKISDFDPDKVADDHLLKQMQAIAPQSLLFYGAKHQYHKGNDRYSRLRNQLLDRSTERVSKKALSLALVKLLEGHVDRDYFTHVPDKGITYHAGVETMEDIEYFRENLGKSVANHLLKILVTVNQQ